MPHGVGRMIRRRVSRAAARRHGRSGAREVLLTLLVGVCVALALISAVGVRLRPMAAAAAQTQAVNTFNRLIEDAILADLKETPVYYRDFVTIERDQTGAITALTTDMSAMNRLRGELLECILDALEGIRLSDVRIPLGSLTNLDVFWGRGPAVKIRSMSVGTARAEFESEFTDAGVNQTLHRIWLEVCVPLKLALPGTWVETQVETRLCVAETVIVGSVPGTYLNAAGRWGA